MDIARDWDARQSFRQGDIQALPQVQLDGVVSADTIPHTSCCSWTVVSALLDVTGHSRLANLLLHTQFIGTLETLQDLEDHGELDELISSH